MQLKDNLKSSLTLANSSNVLNDDNYKKLLEQCFAELIDLRSPNLNNVNNSKPDVIKELHASFLTAIAEFGRHGLTKEDVHQILVKDCNYPVNRATSFADFFEANKLKLQIRLGNIGSHLPHIVDVNWKIDYTLKTSSLDEADGPIFRVTLVLEKYDKKVNGKKLEHVKFSCNTQELQDLVYTLKDAVRHCHKIGSEH